MSAPHFAAATLNGTIMAVVQSNSSASVNGRPLSRMFFAFVAGSNSILII